MKIGIFDSGIGGLTVLRAIRERYDKVDIVYLGDTARVPYGTKSAETVIRYSIECSNFLIDKGIDLLVVACNTASSYALNTLKNDLSIPVVGVIEPGVKKAVRLSKGDKIGVIGTTATIKSGAYQKLLDLYGKKSISKACPLFVPLAEEGITEGEIAYKIVAYYLEDIKREGVDALILGCTHYPLLKNTISKFMGSVPIIDSADAVADEIEEIIENRGEGTLDLYFTDISPNLQDMASRILGESIVVNHINVPCSL